MKAGRKQSHWMWFIFPQIAGLGQSPMSIRFAIASLDEAKAYLAHPVLGPRLRECARLTLDVEGKSARDIFGSIDEMKFRSSMTLFARAAPDDESFSAASTNISPAALTRRRARGFRSKALIAPAFAWVGTGRCRTAAMAWGSTQPSTGLCATNDGSELHDFKPATDIRLLGAIGLVADAPHDRVRHASSAPQRQVLRSREAS